MVLKWHPLFIPDVQQKLVFLGQEGYDIFGKNDMFAPRVKWQSLEKSVEEIKTAAESYENAFNNIISTIEKEQNFKKVSDFDIRTGISESHSLVRTSIGSRFNQLFPGYGIFIKLIALTDIVFFNILLDNVDFWMIFNHL